MVVGAELGRLQDHLEVCVAAALLDRDDLVLHAGVVAGEKRLARDHHVDLVGAGGDRILGVAQFGLERHLAGGEAGGHRCRLHAAAVQRLFRRGHERWVDADGSHGGDLWHRRGRAHALGAQVPNLAGSVGALERRQVDHRHREADALLLGAWS